MKQVVIKISSGIEKSIKLLIKGAIIKPDIPPNIL